MKTDLLNFDIKELSDFIVSIGEPKYRAKQIYGRMYKGFTIDEMAELPKTLRYELSEIAYVGIPKVSVKLVSKLDGTVKYLFSLADGECIESVVMQYEHGYSICVSSQVGCNMGCKFCASTIGGKLRNLSPAEILGQIIAAQKDLGIRISNVVMMGIGEPLDNYDNVIRFLRLVNSEDGLNIGYRHISLSTCGLVDKIKKLAEETFPITLSISLHACDDVTRDSIMPVNRKWNIDELLSACRDYFNKTGRRISFEYTLISGKNDTREQAQKLARLLHKYFEKGVPIHVNLIPVNEVKESGFIGCTARNVEQFARTLSQNGVNATVRRRLGSDINASCGQLRRANTNIAE